MSVAFHVPLFARSSRYVPSDSSLNVYWTYRLFEKVSILVSVPMIRHQSTQARWSSTFQGTSGQQVPGWSHWARGLYGAAAASKHGQQPYRDSYFIYDTSHGALPLYVWGWGCMARRRAGWDGLRTCPSRPGGHVHPRFARPRTVVNNLTPKACCPSSPNPSPPVTTSHRHVRLRSRPGTGAGHLYLAQDTLSPSCAVRP